MDSNKRFESNQKYYTIAVYTVGVVLICALIVRVIFSWQTIMEGIGSIIHSMMPFILGFLIAFILTPLIRFFDHNVFRKLTKNRKVSYAISTVISYIGVITGIVILFYFVVPQLYQSISDIISIKLPEWSTQINRILLDFEEKHPGLVTEEMVDNLQKSIDQWLNVEKITGMLSNVVPSILSTSISVISGVFTVFIAVISSLYMLIDRKIIGRGAKRLLYAIFDRRLADRIIEDARESGNIFGGYIWGKSIDSLIIGCLCFAAMTILRLPYAVLISLIIGITNMIPYFGPYVGAIPGAIMIFLMSPIKTLLYLVMVVILQQFDGLVLGPKILGDFTGLRPIWIIFAITIGGSVGGVLGMFLGVPVVAVLQYLFSRWIDYRLEQKNLAQSEELFESGKTMELPQLNAKLRQKKKTAERERKNDRE